MSLGGFVLCAAAGCFPRVSGDEPFPFTLDDGTKMFSPRERG